MTHIEHLRNGILENKRQIRICEQEKLNLQSLFNPTQWQTDRLEGLNNIIRALEDMLKRQETELNDKTNEITEGLNKAQDQIDLLRGRIDRLRRQKNEKRTRAVDLFSMLKTTLDDKSYHKYTVSAFVVQQSAELHALISDMHNLDNIIEENDTELRRIRSANPGL